MPLAFRWKGREHLLPYGNMVFNAFGPENYIYQQAFAEGDEHARVVMNACKRESLTDTGFGAGIWAKVEEGLITEQQATLLVRALLSAGVDTTIFGIGNTLSVLARHPEAWARLRKEPSLAKFAIDEALRLESPFQKFHRTTTVDTVLGGVGICRQVPRSSSSSGRPTAIPRNGERMRTSSRWNALLPATLLSAWACTSAWASRSRAWKWKSSCSNCWKRSTPSSWLANRRRSCTTSCADSNQCPYASPPEANHSAPGPYVPTSLLE